MSARLDTGEPARLFVAVWPPPSVVAALADVPVGTGRRTDGDRLHTTVRFLGAVAEHAVPALGEALGVAAAVDAAAARLGPATATFGRHVLHVPVMGLDRLAAAVSRALSAPAGAQAFAGDDRPFAGHLTIARSRSRNRSPGEDLRAVAGAAVPDEAQAPWEVAEVTLVASAGGRYDVLGRFPTG